MNRPVATAVRWRFPLLAAGGASLVAGLYAALLLLGFDLPTPRPALAEVHGPVLVLGFVGTLIALERALAWAAPAFEGASQRACQRGGDRGRRNSALGERWGLAAPACAGAGGVVLVLAGPVLVGKLLLAAGGAMLLCLYRALWRRQPGAALLAQASGAFAWYAATLLWLGGMSIPDLVPWLAVFVVATIAGERLELAHVALTGPSAGRWFLASLALLVAAATATTLWPARGAYLFGAALLAMVAWLVVFDVARRTVRARGLPRYIAVGLLGGYAWLGLAGLLWAGGGPATAGSSYDARVHAVFLGFTMSMIFVHAPVILPAVLRRPLPYHPVLYAPLALLHLSLLVRVALGDGVGWEPVWRWSGFANVVAILGFAASAIVLAVRASHSTVDVRPVVGVAR